MAHSKTFLSALVAAAGLAFGGQAQAQISDDVVKIGILNDMSGPYADFAGPGSVLAAQMAIDDAGGSVLGKRIELVMADHQNKTDVGLAVARKWYDVEKVDVIADLPNSAIALAIQDLARNKRRMTINVANGSTELTGKSCSPTSVAWVSDSYSYAHGTTSAVLKQGGDSWFFFTLNFEGGLSSERESTKVLEANGGKVVGRVRHPINAGDFSSMLLQAQGSGAKIIGLANAGADMVTAVKQASEFGIATSKQKLVALLANITDIHSLGLPAARGLMLTEAWYWDLNEETRAFGKRFKAKHGSMPTQYQAGMYSAIAHYLKAIKESKTDDALAVTKKMREMPVNDMFARGGVVREDGRMVHDMYLVQVKEPKESKTDWDYYRVLSTIPGKDAFKPLNESDCPLVKK